MVLNKVALTGASGMIGRHLIRQLSEKHIACATTSRRKPEFLPEGSDWFSWDLREWKSVEELDAKFGKVDALIHLAALLPLKEDQMLSPELFDVNVRAALCLGKWAAEKNIPMIFVSSATVYGNPDRPRIREDAPRIASGLGGFYGLSKALAEQLLQFLAGQGLRVCILRPSAVYGDGLPDDKMITRFLNLAGEGKQIELNRPADDRVNLIHADDVASAILEALQKDAFGIFNVASREAKTLREIALTCVGALGRGGVKVGSNGVMRSARTRFDLCCDAAAKAFGFEARVDLPEGIRRMWQAMGGDSAGRNRPEMVGKERS